MKKDISIFKKLKLFNSYKRTIDSNKNELELKYGIRIDSAKRMYTVLNIPEEIIGEAYSLKKSDIDRISENYIRGFSSDISTYLKGKGLNELFDFYEIKKVEKYSYLIIFGFSQFKSTTYYNILYYFLTPSLIISLILSLIFMI